MFDDTIKNNILYAKNNATKNELDRACQYAAADEFIKKLPQGYDTLIGENGVRLGGQNKEFRSLSNFKSLQLYF